MNATSTFRMKTTHVRQAVALYEAGRSIHSISKELRISRKTLAKHLREKTSIRTSWEQKAFRLKLSPWQEKELVRLYEANTPMYELKAIFKRSHHFINRVIARHGFELRSREKAQRLKICGDVDTARTILIVEMYDRLGMSTIEISQELGRCVRYVRKRLPSASIRTKSENNVLRYIRLRETATQREERDRRVRELISNFRREFQTAP